MLDLHCLTRRLKLNRSRVPLYHHFQWVKTNSRLNCLIQRTRMSHQVKLLNKGTANQRKCSWFFNAQVFENFVLFIVVDYLLFCTMLLFTLYNSLFAIMQEKLQFWVLNHDNALFLATFLAWDCSWRMGLGHIEQPPWRSSQDHPKWQATITHFWRK